MRKQGYYGSSRQRSALVPVPSRDWRTFYTEEKQIKEALEFWKLVEMWKDHRGKFQAYMMHLNLGERRRRIEQIWFAMNLQSSRSFEYFASHAKTKDEHESGLQTVKAFPTRAEKPYLWEIADEFEKHAIIAVEKSRQLMLTWLCCLFALWTAKYQPNQLIFLQSKKEEDAANLVFNTEPNHARISFIETHLPVELQCRITWSFGKAFMMDSGSRIWGVPEGGDQIRSYTPSLIISDEFAFQPEAEFAWKAMKPALTGGGRAILVSSARNGSFMKRLLERDFTEAA